MELTDKKLEYLKKTIPVLIGDRIKYFRNQKGLTQTQLAGKVGKDRQYLYKIEKGIVTPNIVTISALAIAMNVSLKDIFDIEIS